MPSERGLLFRCENVKPIATKNDITEKRIAIKSDDTNGLRRAFTADMRVHAGA